MTTRISYTVNFIKGHLEGHSRRRGVSLPDDQVAKERAFLDEHSTPETAIQMIDGYCYYTDVRQYGEAVLEVLRKAAI